MISIHALLAESDVIIIAAAHSEVISIHALLAESDIRPSMLRSDAVKISIHALLAESDRVREQLEELRQLFLSTLSLRRATAYAWTLMNQLADFYPRSPCGERPK